MSVHCVQANSCWVHSGNNKIGTDVSLVLEEVLLQHGHAGDYARLAASGEGVKLELRGDDCSREFGIGSSTSTRTPDLRGDVMKLLAVLISVLVDADCT